MGEDAPWVWRGLVLMVLMLLGASCGSGDGSGDEGSGSVSATLGIISTNIETDVEGAGFSEAEEGQLLGVGDQVRTDQTGFAELTFHDGSWMRVESEAVLTIEDLADSDSGQAVQTSIDTGQAWSRVRELTEPEDDFQLDTPVATAAVRGTAFAVSCESAASCTFSVLEGEVVVTPDGGDAITLKAGQTLTVTNAGESPVLAQPGVPALSEEPFVAKNLERDQKDAGVLPPTLVPQEEATGIGGTYDVTTTVTDGNSNFPVGQVGEFALTISTDCSADGCVVKGDQGLGLGVRSGDGILFSGTGTEPCPSDSSITASDAYEVRLSFDGEGLSGKYTQTTIDSGGCPDAEVDPIASSWEGRRRD